MLGWTLGLWVGGLGAWPLGKVSSINRPFPVKIQRAPQAFLPGHLLFEAQGALDGGHVGAGMEHVPNAGRFEAGLKALSGQTIQFFDQLKDRDALAAADIKNL